MKISRLLELDRQYLSKQSLALCFGDSFLNEHNSIYAAIKKGALDNGFIYSTDVDPSYAALPLSQLDVVLKNKKIPYFDNVSVLLEVEKKIPQMTQWDEVSDNLKRNFIFHESCHAVSRSEADVIFNNEKVELKIILKLMIEESFSNACELMAIVDVEQPAHRLFYEANSYIYVLDYRVHLRDLTNEFGIADAFKFILFCYLYSNFLHDLIDDQKLNQILGLLRLTISDPKKLKKLKAISRIAFQLNPRFRMVTSGFYMRLNGFNLLENELAQSKFMVLLESDPRYLQLLDILVRKIK